MKTVGEDSIGTAIVVQDVDGTGTPGIAASRCPVCSEVRVPPRVLCPNDLSGCEPHTVAGEGVVYEAVVIAMAPTGFEAPFCVGYIDLDESARMFAQIAWADGDEEPTHGDRVSIKVEKIGAPDHERLAPVFHRSVSTGHHG